MVTPTRGMSLDALAAVANPAGMSRASLNGSTTSFAQQLAASLESYLGQSSAATRLEIDVLPQQRGNPGTRQFIVTVRDTRSPSASDASRSVPPGSLSGESMYSGTPAAAVAVVAAPPEEPAPTNEIEAYWASQPKEVRVLRTIDDYEERGIVARRLGEQGFIIDHAIMVLRWDPYMTNKGRLEEGYTWIPSIMQNPIPVSPGLAFPGLPSYDPNNPPPGSVMVSTDFAIGLEHTSPGARPPHPANVGGTVYS